MNEKEFDKKHDELNERREDLLHELFEVQQKIYELFGEHYDEAFPKKRVDNDGQGATEGEEENLAA